MYHLMLGDCLERLKELPDNYIDAVVTDPPYGLAFMGKKWDYDIPQQAIWEQCLRVLKPGGHLLAFAGSRTHHRMASRIEDAGFEIRDMIVWVYGSGFPKSHNVGKAITAYEKTGGSAPRNLRKTRQGDRYAPTGQTDYRAGRMFSNDLENDLTETELTNTAQKWAGWGTALKPAIEPITVARKPFAGSVANNVLEYGTGALNIEGCRIGDDIVGWGGKAAGGNTWNDDNMGLGKDGDPRPVEGRWPANFMHNDIETEWAKFFYCPKTSKKDRDEGMDDFEEREHIFFQTANGTSGKPSSLAQDRSIPSYRNTHPTVKPTELMRYLCRLVTPPGGIVVDPFMGSGSTGKAALLEGFEFIGIEMSADYMKIAEARIKAVSKPDLFL